VDLTWPPFQGLNEMELDIEDATTAKKETLSPGLRMLVISIGFMTDAYDLFVIGIVLVIIRRLYGENTTAEALLATAVLFGTNFRRLFFPQTRKLKIKKKSGITKLEIYARWLRK